MNKSQTEATESVVPRSAVATPEDVKRFLEKTEDEVAELQKEQALQLYRSRARLTDNERRVGRGVELERHHRITGNADGLAEALALQGKYIEAADIAQDPVRRAEYTEKAMAVECDDSDCDCDSFRDELEYNLPNQHIEFYGHSTKHGKEMPFIRCSVCKKLNAMPSPKHLIEQRTLRNSQASDVERLKFFKK